MSYEPVVYLNGDFCVRDGTKHYSSGDNTEGYTVGMFDIYHKNEHVERTSSLESAIEIITKKLFNQFKEINQLKSYFECGNWKIYEKKDENVKNNIVVYKNICVLTTTNSSNAMEIHKLPKILRLILEKSVSNYSEKNGSLIDLQKQDPRQQYFKNMIQNFKALNKLISYHSKNIEVLVQDLAKEYKLSDKGLILKQLYAAWNKDIQSERIDNAGNIKTDINIEKYELFNVCQFKSVDPRKCVISANTQNSH